MIDCDRQIFQSDLNTEPKVNLKQLSEYLKLSQTTVSRALNGYPEVNEDTRRRVADAARHFNYRPSPNAARLATGKSRTIGHIVPLSDHRMINPHFSDFIAGAGETYAGTGYDMLISVVEPEKELSTYRNFAASRRVDGVIVHGPLVDDPRIDLLHELKLPFVVHGRSNDPEGTYSWLDVNNRRSFKRATELLIDLGHSRIAHVNGLENMCFAARRRDGYLEALKGRGIEPDPNLSICTDMIEPHGYEAVKRFLAQPDPPTAIMASSIILALGASRAMQEAGQSPGQDISLIAHDDCLSSLYDNNNIPAITSIRSSIREAGQRVAQILINLIEDPGSGPVNELWEADLVLGKSTGPCRQAGNVRADQAISGGPPVSVQTN